MGQLSCSGVTTRNADVAALLAPNAGACIGLDSAFMSIITVWLSDLKLGYCANGWYLNRKFCCWEMGDGEGDGCPDWKEWTQFGGVQWLVYVAMAVSLPRVCVCGSHVGD